MTLMARRESRLGGSPDLDKGQIGGSATPHPDGFPNLVEAAGQPTNLLVGHSWTMFAHHLSKVLRKSTDLLLQKKEGGLEGTQLSFINNKGECLHGSCLSQFTSS